MEKQQIIDEIRRLAAEIGTVPGVRQFERLAGIHTSDWQSHAPRWSDLVAEAGLTPNSLKVAYDDDFLIAKLIGLTRHLGRFPARADIVFAGTTDLSMPHVTVFGRRRAVADWVRLVRAYCAERDEFSDVIAICDARKTRTREVPIDSGQEGDSGYVYLQQSGRYYKIGFTNHTGRRNYELGVLLPEEITVLHEIRTDDPRGVEAYWHQRFAKKRRRNAGRLTEWFDLDANDVRTFKRWKSIW